MADTQIQESRTRRWPLMLALALGLLGGAAADAVVTLRAQPAAAVPAESATSHQATAALPVSNGGWAANHAAKAETAGACSCVEGAEFASDRSPLAPRRKSAHPTRRNAPIHADRCAAVAVAAQ